MERTTFADAEERAEVYLTYDSPTTNAAIADAKQKYADRHDVDKSNLTARKYGSGYDRDRGSAYMMVVVGPSYIEVR